MRKAVVDVGSNSVLLLVEKFDGTRWSPIYESTNVSSLGENTKATGVLGEAGMSRTLDALKTAFAKARELGAGEAIAAVTMAGRIASNTHVFLERAAKQSTPVFVLSGNQEAELGFRAVASDPAFADEERISIVDVGGQSTELTTAWRNGDDWEVPFRRSYPVGTLALSGGTLASECPDGLAQLRACKEIDEILGLCYLPGQAGKVVSLGATGTNLVSIREAMTTWQPERVHGALLGYDEISVAASRLFAMPFSSRAAIPGIEEGREKTLPIGALILERFLAALRAEVCAVSVRGWRHALLEEGLPSG